MQKKSRICASELLIRHDRGGEIVVFRQWQPAEAVLLECKKEGLIEMSLLRRRRQRLCHSGDSLNFQFSDSIFYVGLNNYVDTCVNFISVSLELKEKGKKTAIDNQTFCLLFQHV